MFWTRVQELEEGGSGGNWDIFQKWSQHYSPSQWGQEQVKKRRTSGDPLVFVKIDGRMGLPPTEMGEGYGGNVFGKKNQDFTYEQTVFDMSILYPLKILSNQIDL